ncbi:hypothetical protein PtA15_10A153 [Puccinia triticina]|uniref:Uncharacterized protein n=1 Tax=Puccinia triticina TaxID=208348 RepID=A0ABY7CVR8_9BASI|nr:uncharacterized protein PtA15_10A153 [Puccinia triticina]WAQ88734.1 hypothetical protein PtA15_10A153 [Puccinia triticina]WAR58800.1 hypothetical protein PtB15_10B139 [Puccinia triticina]
MMMKLIDLPDKCPNRLGYIPLKCGDPNVLLEKEREHQCKFEPCGCSNCNPEQQSVIVRNLKNLTVDNITGFLECPVDLPSRSDENSSVIASLDQTNATCPVAEMIRPSATKNKLSTGLETFATYLFECLGEFFDSIYDVEDCYFAADKVFSMRGARAAVLATEKGFHKDRLELSNPVEHLDPLLFESSLSALQQGPKKTKKQQAAEESKKRTAAKREVKKAQNAVDERRKKEEATKKAKLKAKKKEEEDMAKAEGNRKSAKQKSDKDASAAQREKRSRRTQGDLEELHQSTT